MDPSSMIDLSKLVDSGGLNLTEEQVSSIVSQIASVKDFDRTGEDLLILGIRICKQRPNQALIMLTKLPILLEQTKEHLITLKLLTEFACSLPAIIAFLFNTAEALPLWTTILEIKNIIANRLLTSQHAGIVIRSVRILQLMVVMWSKKSEEVEPVEEDIDLPKGGAIRGSIIREEGIRTLDKLIALIWTKPPFPALVAAINLLGRITRARPIFLPKIVPALIDLLEGLSSLALLEHQQSHLEHTLEKQLEGLMENTAAEKYYPLIVEALKKASTKFGKRKKIEDDEDDSDLAHVGTKKLKTGADRADIDVTTVPLYTATEVVLVTLLRSKVDQFKAALEIWRPSVPTIATTRDPRRADPRHPPIEEQESSSKVDQVVPFTLMARSINDIEIKSLLRSRLTEIFNNMSNLVINAGIKKTRLRSYARLITLLDSDHLQEDNYVIDILLDCCFKNLPEHMSLLLYWLQLVWLQSSVERQAGLYAKAYSMTISRLQEVVADAQPQWEVHLQRFFNDVPELVDALHITLLQWICTNAPTRISGLALVEHLIINRPAITDQLIHLLLSMCIASDDSLRKAAIFVANKLLAIPRVASLIKVAAKVSLEQTIASTTTDESLQIDLVLHVALRSDLITLFVKKFNDLPLTIQQHCVAQVPLISLDSVIAKNIIDVGIKSDPLGSLMERVVESLCKNNALDDDELVDKALDNIQMGNWPVRLLDRMIIYSNLEQLQPAMITFFSSIDPNEDDQKPLALSLLTKIADKFGASELLCRLHFIDIPLKRQVDYIQLCLTLLKPDAIASALQTLVASEELPAMLMRTLIQSITLHRGMTGLVVGLLARLIAREIWNTRLWDGFIRCIRTLGHSAYAVLLQLPAGQLESLLGTIPEMRDGFINYLQQQSVTIQSRHTNLLDKTEA